MQAKTDDVLFRSENNIWLDFIMIIILKFRYFILILMLLEMYINTYKSYLYIKRKI